MAADIFLHTCGSLQIRMSARYRKATLLLLALVVLCYQTAGTLGEWVMTGSLLAAAQDFRIGIPGMLLQVFGGWVFINRIIRR